MKPAGHTLRDARTHAGVSLRALSRHIGVAPSTLCRVEHGQERASDRIVEGYIEALSLGRDATYREIDRVPAEVLAALKRSPDGFERVRSGLDSETSETDASTDVDTDPDIAALESLLDCDGVRDEERETFEAWVDLLASGKLERLSSKQRSRVVRVRRRLGDLGDEPGHLFTRLSTDQQVKQRDDAKRVVLPWEREGYTTPHKLPQG